MLIAPVRLGKESATGAGAVVTKDVPDGYLAVGAPARMRRRKTRNDRSDVDDGPEVPAE
jgi:serine acetyltransferase